MSTLRHFALPLFLLLAACSSAPSSRESAYAAADDGEGLPISEAGVENVAIIGTNDLHGALVPTALSTRETDGRQAVSYEAGGATVLASYLRILRDQHGDRLLWLDGGDEFQGSIESNSEQGAPMVDFYNQLGLNAAAIGNHEFDFGAEKGGSPSDTLGALKARQRQARYPYLAANIEDRHNGRLYAFPNTLPSTLLRAGRIKVGVIGLSTTETPKTTRPDFVRPLLFSDLKAATLREAKSLREQGAQVVVVTAHVGLKCAPGRASLAPMMRKPTTPQGECDSTDELVQLLTSLPTGTVDAVVSGHSHQVVHHWVAGVPVIQGGAFGRYFNVIHLAYDTQRGKLLTDRTRIEGPIPVCPAVFQHQGDCNGDRPAPRNGRGPLVSPDFHGKTIGTDPETDRLLRPVIARTQPIKHRVVGTVALPIEHPRFAESALGNLVADAAREATHADVALVNSGGIRAPWKPGPLTYGDVFKTLPFENTVVTTKVTGQELKTILRVAESGSRGFSPVSGLKLRLLDFAADAPSDDINGDQRVEPWEINRLLEVRLDNGEAISDSRYYTLATLDFLMMGGDDVGWALSRLPTDRVSSPEPAILLREAVLQRIASLRGPINSTQAPLVEPKNRRVAFEKPRHPKKGQKSRRHRRRAKTR